MLLLLKNSNYFQNSPYAPGVAFGLKQKLSRLKDCKRVNISFDIDPFAIFQPRGFGSAQMLFPVRKVSSIIA